MDESDRRDPSRFRRAEDTVTASWESALLAEAAVALLRCRTDDEVYDVIGDTMARLCPGAMIIVNEISPDLETFATRKIAGAVPKPALKLANLVGFDILKKRFPISPELRSQLLEGTLTRMPGGFAGLALAGMPKVVSSAIIATFGQGDLFAVGITDKVTALGNLVINAATGDVGLPTSAIESFAHHCFSALDVIRRTRELADSEERFRAVFENASDGICLLATDGALVFLNPAFAEMHGYTIDEMLVTSLAELVTPETAELTRKRTASVLEGSPMTFEVEHVRKNGDTFSLEVSANPVDIGGERYVMAFHRDITERKRVEAALRESDAGLNALIEQSLDGIVVADEEGTLTIWNGGMVNLTGIAECDAVGRPIWELQARIVPEEHRSPGLEDRLRDGFVAIARTASEWHRPPQDRTIERIDGALRAVQDSPFLVRTEGSMRFCTVLRDITDRKQAEAEIERRGIRLQGLLEAREHDLERLGRALLSTVEIVSQVVETRDPYTAGHQRRVAELSVRIAQQMGMSAAEVDEIHNAALLHDVGKMSVPADILSRPGVLSPIEFELIKGHAEAGYRIIASAHMEGPTAEIVYQHHERCDGSGYPRGLSADELLPASKILAVADVVEAMASHRPYRAALGVDAALAEIERGAGTLYDAEVAESCLRIFRIDGFAFLEV